MNRHPGYSNVHVHCSSGQDLYDDGGELGPSTVLSARFDRLGTLDCGSTLWESAGPARRRTSGWGRSRPKLRPGARGRE